MAFMKGEITGKRNWLNLETDHGIWFVSVDKPEPCLTCLERNDQDMIDWLLQFTLGNELWDVSLVIGYGVRLSAPGYLDCTDWDVFTNKHEAEKALRVLERGE